MRAIIALLCLQIGRVRLELEWDTLLPAGLLNGGEEVANQLIGSLEFVRDELPGAPEAVPVMVPVIVSLGARKAVCVIKAQQPAPIVIVQGK